MRYGILGSLAVWDDDREVSLGGPKQRALLGVLLLHANELVPTARLVDELWGEQPPATAVKTVQVYVSQLRKALGEKAIETRAGGYLLRLDPGALDSHRFQDLLERGRQLLAENAAEEAAGVLREALGLWRGPALADFQYELFARNEIGRLDELRLAAVEQRLEADLALGRDAEMVGELEALVRDHPLRESLCGLLILALYRAGRQADALAAYQGARARLVDELGLDPSQALQRLEKAILVHDPSLDLTAAPTPAPRRVPPSRPAEPTPAEPSIDARKTVTVLFCDVVAYTELGERLDPEALRHVMSRYFEQAAAVLERHGGTVEKFVGDEVMAVFGVPAVREDDALRAVRAALELRESVAALETGLASGARLEVRIGVNTGEVVAGNPAAGHGFVTGDPVTVGKRLEQAAAPGEILLGEETHVLVAHAVEASPLELQKLKGKGREVAAYRLESVHAEATAVRRRDDTPLVGRMRELESLRAYYSEVASGSGAQLVTIVGEPGIGKSRLAREFTDGVAAEATVLVGRCPPYGEGITFWPLRELLRQTGRAEEELAGSSHEVFAAMRRVLEELARERPVVAVFDDVHWAEPTFLDLVEYLADRLGTAPVLLLCLARPQLGEQRPAWLQAPATVLTLEPLSEVDSELMLEALDVPTAARRRIAEAAEGNPLFAEQLAAIADEFDSAVAMPGSIRGVLHERLDRLDPGERSVLECAAVAGRSFSFGAVLELTPPEERERVHERLLALVRRKLVRPDTIALDEGFRFQHALIREATYDGMQKAVRAELHNQIGARLEAQGAENALAGYHLEQAFWLRGELGHLDAEVGARAGRLLRLAGQEAFGRSDVSAAVALFERARALLPSDDPAQPALLTELGSVQIRAGMFADAEATLGRAAAEAEHRGDRRAGLRAALELQFLASFTAPVEARDVAAAERLMPELEAVGDHLGLAKAWWLRSEGDALACRWSARAVSLEQALAHAQRAADAHDEVGTITALLAQALYYGPTPADQAVARCEELLREAGGDRPLRAALTSTLGGLYAMRGDLELGRSSYADAVAVYDELGLRFRRAARAHIGAQIALLRNDPAEAERELRAGLDTLAEIGARGVHTTLGAVLADIWSELGRDNEADELARKVAGAVAQDDLAPQVLWRVALARVLVHRGEAADAEALIAEALDLAAAIDFPDLRARALMAAAEVTGNAQLLDQARGVYEAKGNAAAAAQVGILQDGAGLVARPPAE